MDEHGLPIVGTGVDYTKVPALEHKNTLVFLNSFVTQTAQFLNRFSAACEERLGELSLRIQRLDISLNILEAKLSSIPDLDGIQATQQYQPPGAVATAGATTSGPAAPSSTQQGAPPPPSSTAPPSTEAPVSSSTADQSSIPPPQPTQEEAQATRKKKAKDDPRYAKYFKMKRLGVNPLQIQMEMRNHGLNPDILQDEEAELPDSDQSGGVGGTRGGGGDDEDDSEVGTTASSSSGNESDDSFESD